MRKVIADLPVAAIPVSTRPMPAAIANEPVVQIVVGALGVAFLFLVARIIGQIS